MLAALYRGNPRLTLEDWPQPVPGPGELLVRVAACGICHTDLHYLDHGVPTFKKPPLVLGHEISGTVAGPGAGVKNFREGDRVLIPAVLTCGQCRACRSGRENICDAMRMLGNHIDGGFAEFVVAPAKDCFSLPSEIPLADASIIADAVSTPYHAVKHRAQVRTGSVVAVFGCGGVGMNVVQCAVVAGGRVIAVDVDPKKLELAGKLGAAATVNPKEVERVDKELKKMTGGGCDIAIEAIGKPETIRLAYESVRRGGRVCVIGYSAEEVTLAVSKLMFYELEMVGSLGCRPVDYPEIIELVRVGRLQLAPLITGRIPLEQINDGFDALRQGRALRTIVLPAPIPSGLSREPIF